MLKCITSFVKMQVRNAFDFTAEELFEDTYGHRVFPRAETEKAEKVTISDTKEFNIMREGKVRERIQPNYQFVHESVGHPPVSANEKGNLDQSFSCLMH